MAGGAEAPPLVPSFHRPFDRVIHSPDGPAGRGAGLSVPDDEAVGGGGRMAYTESVMGSGT